MSPTSYQTAPPRDLMIATVFAGVKLRRHAIQQKRTVLYPDSTGEDARASAFSASNSLLHFRPLACVHDFSRIDCGVVDLFFENPSIFADEKIHAARGFVLVHVKTVLVGASAAPITE